MSLSVYLHLTRKPRCSMQNVITISDGGRYSQATLEASYWCWGKHSENPLTPSVSPKPTGLASGSKMCCQTHQSPSRAAPESEELRDSQMATNICSRYSTAFQPTASLKETLPCQESLMLRVPISYGCTCGRERGGPLREGIHDKLPAMEKWVGPVKGLSYKMEQWWSQLILVEAEIKTKEAN